MTHAPLDLATAPAADIPLATATPTAGRRVLLVSNRLPVTVAVHDGRAHVERSVGGLATGLAGPHERSGGLWIGWPGPLDGVNAAGAAELDRELAARRCVPVPLTPGELAQYYDGIANGVLWPLFHDRLDRMPLLVEGWEVYEAVNARFADVVAAHYRPGDVVWVHDYQLLRVPALLRARLPRARIGFFLHVPFPAPDLFATLPPRAALLDGLLGADLVGFHTARYRQHFLDAVRRFLPGGRAETGAAGVFPMGVDAAVIGERAASREVAEASLALRDDRHWLLVGVDRLDYSKGIPRRLLAFEQLLLRHPEWRDRVRLVQVAVPSREGVAEYQTVREHVAGLVGRINGAFATPAWTPIQYLHRSMDETTLLALYRAADVMLVTPIRDGMNLVAKEFVASRADEGGVLVLSEFAGAAAELADAVLVNPYDVQGTSDAVHAALTMDGAERRRRMRALRACVAANDVHTWADAFLAALDGSAASGAADAGVARAPDAYVGTASATSPT